MIKKEATRNCQKCKSKNSASRNSCHVRGARMVYQPERKNGLVYGGER